MEFLLLFLAYVLLGVLRRRPVPTPSITITIIEQGGDDRPPRNPRPGPRDEPETILANERAAWRWRQEA